MVQKRGIGRTLFVAFNYTFLLAISVLCLLPLVHVLSVSFSSSAAAMGGLVKLWPVQFTPNAYEYVLKKPEFLTALWITLKRVVLGVSISMFLTILTAYPLAKEKSKFKWRTMYAWLLVLTMLFNGGLIPWYMTIKSLGMLDSIWALVLPGAVPVFNVILLLNFYRGLPKELEESAFMDGAGHWTTLWRIYAPLSLPALATIGLFTIVSHWNSWFDGLILMNSPENYPLQSYLRTIIVGQDLTMLTSTDLSLLQDLSEQTVKTAQIFLGALPIILVYPFLQRFFIKGIVMGSVKG
ncbi:MULTISPECIES: carbohydrate ABC transporter permease [Paenibacillus]|uniref:ABC transporter permease n=2 Tax=Paenibacillus TaxID=44249 RepID=A0A1R1EZ85_9BACL|nr:MULTISPECIES: carbohydrate ABC transporter permease [Paenibacillus]OMF57118.1 ABC transporter permease [Paenibacillus rhizosphaerae]OXL84202.1 ABC transporter permease [Paenibacillus sp. SSG-1]GIO54757.1 protein LplC [Paenibacillus cineris]GIO59532.1 protein LplC [Paenibacillus cineris]